MNITKGNIIHPSRSFFTDTVYGYTAYAKSKIAAWMLIRNICHDLDLEVPTVDQIIEMETSLGAKMQAKDSRNILL